MKRHIFELSSLSPDYIKNILIDQCAHQEYFSLLDSNNHKDAYSRYDWLVALDAEIIFQPSGNSFEELKEFHQLHGHWLFGHLCFDLKDELEAISTSNPDTVGFKPMLFFVPKTLVYSREGKITVETTEFENETDWLASLSTIHSTVAKDAIELVAQTSQQAYLNKVASLKEHLQYGNIYEINYCIEFSNFAKKFNPTSVFKQLNNSARAPFAAFYKNGDKHLLCASPERYLHKDGDTLTSQPIKGTIKRAATSQEDEQLKKELLASEKERSENVMITDLVRNDLSQTAAKASVKVTELFGIYTFNTVHQMISTIQSRLAETHHFTEALQTTFPMGSMTGAPKPRAMQLIEEHETFARNLYAGAVGYITPNGDFDFNVVIRSLFYNAETDYLSARVGSAITIHCNAVQEYEECLLKAENLFSCLR